MTYTQLIFISLFIALNVALCVTTLVMVNATQQMIYDFKKEFRRFRDGEQYQCRIENPVIGVKLNPDGNWSEIRANDKHIENGR